MTDPPSLSLNFSTTFSPAESSNSALIYLQENGGGGSGEKSAFEQVIIAMKVLQWFVGLFGNAISLSVLLLYRHFLSHPFWFYLVMLCTVDLIGCVAFLIEMEEPIDVYHTFLFKRGHVNIQLETWVLNMIRDLSAWLIVFIAIERWKSVCWNQDRPHHSRYSQHYQNHHQWSPPRRSNQHVASTNSSSTPSPPLGVFGFSSFKRNTAQLETFFIVAGGLMIINAINYFANENLWGNPEQVMQYQSSVPNDTEAKNRSTSPYPQPPRAASAASNLADQWSRAWPFVKEIKQCWLPAIVLLVLNCWIVVHTIRFLWNSPPLHLITGRRFGFRRLTSTSISTPTPGQTGSTTPLNPAALNPPPQTVPPPQQQNQGSIVYHRSMSLRRRRLVFAWLTLLALPTIFIAFTLPLSIFNVLDEFIKVKAGELPGLLIRDSITHWLADCNHTINCFIYCLTIAKFRMALCRMWHSFTGCCSNCYRVLTKKEQDEGDADHREQQCQLVSLIERARQLRRCRNAKKRRFVVGVVENVEAISDFQQQRQLAAQLGIRRASGMESGIAFDENAHYYG